MKSYVCFLLPLCSAAIAQAQIRPPSFHVTTFAGSDRNGDGGPAISAQFAKIQGIAVDRTGNLYLSDTDHHRIRKVTPTGQITTLAGTGVPGYSGDGGLAGAAQLSFPYGLAADAGGNLYIADLGNNRIRRVAANGAISTIAPDTVFATPRNLALDDSGNLYVSEFDGHRVRRISPDGRVVTVAGTGKPGFSGDSGAPEQAQLAYPCGIAIDRGGALLIADSGNNRVRRIFANGVLSTILGGSAGTALATPVALATDSMGNIYVGDSSPVVRAFSISGKWSDVAGGSTPGFGGDGGAATRATLTSVRDLAVDSANNLYIADGVRARRVNVFGIISTIAGDGFLTNVGDGGPPTDAILSRPSAVSIDNSGALLIADTGTGRIRRVTAGQISTSAPALNEPMGVAADTMGTTYIADTANNLVRSLGTDGRLRNAVISARLPRSVCFSRTGVLHVADTGNGRILRVTAATAEVVGANLNAPEACAFDAAGNLYVAETDAHRIRKLSPSGDWSTVAGTGEAGSSDVEEAARSARLTFPRGIALDDSGSLYISDTGGNRIRVVTADGIIHTVAGVGFAGFTGDGGDAASARFNAPAGLALDSSGVLYVADSGNDRIRRLEPQAAISELLASAKVVNALSGAAGPLAPGTLVLISGDGLGGPAGGDVWFDQRQVPVLASSQGQITAQVPDDLAGAASTHLEIRTAGRTLAAADLPLAATSPGILPMTLNASSTINGPVNPAVPGGMLIVFATGLGKLEYLRPATPVTATVAGLPADVVEAMASETLPGVVIAVIRFPGGLIPSGEVPLVLTAGGVPSNSISVWLR